MENKNGMAGVFSFFIPGLGHLYRGLMLQGFLSFVLTIMGYFFFIIPGFIIHAYVIYDSMKPSPQKQDHKQSA